MPICIAYVASYVVHSYVSMSSFIDKDKCCSIINISIIVLGILTCGTSVLLWWIYKRISECGDSKKKYDLGGTYIATYVAIYMY